MRIVLDTAVLVRAHPRSRSMGRKVLRAALEGAHKLILSNEIISETTRVLRYPRLQKLHAMSDEQIYEYSQFLRSVAELVILKPSYHAPLRDLNDLDVMQTAELGEADALCSNDRDFHAPSIVAYCTVRGIKLCDEASLLSLLLPT